MSLIADWTVRELVDYCESTVSDIEMTVTRKSTGGEIRLNRCRSVLYESQPHLVDDVIALRSVERDFTVYIFHRDNGVSYSMMCMNSKGRVVPCDMESVVGELMAV